MLADSYRKQGMFHPTFGRKVHPARERRLPDIIVTQKTNPDAKDIQRMVRGKYHRG
jgi:hypothetical protein